MSEGQSRFRLPAQAAFACATLHVLATVAMAVLLRRGLPPSPPADRLHFLQSHPFAWRGSWALWIVTTMAMGLFYLSFHRAVDAGWRGRLAVGLAVLGMGGDAMGDALFLWVYPGIDAPGQFAELDRRTAFLSAGLANGGYTLAWMLLLWRAPIPRRLSALSIPGVAGGILLALAGFANWTPGLLAGTAVAIPAFTLWCAFVGRFFWKKRRDAATMSAHV